MQQLPISYTFLTRNPNSANRYPLRELKRPFNQQVFHEFNVQGSSFCPWKSFTFHAAFILLASFPFSKSKTLNFFNRSKTYVKLCLVYLYSQHKIWRSWSHNLVKTWLVFAYIKCQKCNCFAWDINKFLGTLWHVLTITDFLACRK